ncbi:MAG: FAD-dependent oxidoreductase [Cyanobacteriota bacterium]|nr:FAD-dependent oxidoreductase [Cyanobacteriota bacterium]
MTRVAIIGCGAIGAAIAYELSAIAELEITLLDCNEPATGATRAALGVLMGAISRKTKGRAWQLRQASLQRYETLIPELEALVGYPIPFNRQGLVRLCFEGENLQQWEKLREIRSSQGWPLEWWDREQLRRNCPQVECDRVEGAIYSPRDRQVHPVQLTRALVTAAQMRGVNCKFGVEVQNLGATDVDANGNRRCDRIFLGDATLEIDALIVAAGIGSTPLIANLERPVQPPPQCDVRPVLGQALHLQLPEPLGNAEFQPVISGDDINLVPLGQEEYWVGATVEFPNAQGEVAADATLLQQLQENATAFCPNLTRGKILSTWSGLRPRPQGRPAPIIEPLAGYSNIILATGHYRNGILLAPVTAQLARSQLEAIRYIS